MAELGLGQDARGRTERWEKNQRQGSRDAHNQPSPQACAWVSGEGALALQGSRGPGRPHGTKKGFGSRRRGRP